MANFEVTRSRPIIPVVVSWWDRPFEEVAPWSSLEVPLPASWPSSGLSAFVSIFCNLCVEEFLFEFPASSFPLSLMPAPLPNL